MADRPGDAVSDYILTALRFDQILEQDDKGRVTKRIRHRTGALITDLDGLEAERLLAAGAIIPADQARAGGDSESVGNTDSDSDHGDDDPGGESSGTPADAPRRPRATATLERWAAYAKALGIDAEKVDAMPNKDDIIAAVDALDAE